MAKGETYVDVSGRDIEGAVRKTKYITLDAELYDDYYTNSFAVGKGSTAETDAIAIFGKANAENSIQIGYGDNNDVNTAKINNTTVVDANGKIPLDSTTFKAGTNVEIEKDAEGNDVINVIGGGTGESAINSISVDNKKLPIDERKNVNVSLGDTLNFDNNVLNVNVNTIEHPIHYIDLSSTPTYTSTLEPATYIVRTAGILRNNEDLDVGFNVNVGAMFVVHSNGRATIFNGSVIIRLAQDTTREDITSRACYYDTDAEINAKLINFIKNTDYATDTVGGVIKLGYGLVTTSDGKTAGIVETRQGYSSWDNRLFVSKGTIENLKIKSTDVNPTLDDISIPTTEFMADYIGDNTQAKTTFNTPTDDVNTLIDNNVAPLGTLASSTTVTIPSNIQQGYCTGFTFNEPSTVFTLEIDHSTSGASKFNMIGTDCEDGLFTPVANKHYEVTLWFDGYALTGVVNGVTL